MIPASRSRPRPLRAAALALLAATLPACGAKGPPLPPFRPAPPAPTGFEVNQRGGTAILEFDPVLATQPVEGGVVQVERVELLLYAERYAAMTPEILATALDRERFERLEQAEEAAGIAERLAEERRIRREAEAAGEGAEVPSEDPADLTEEEPAPEEDEEEGLTESERLIRGVPDEVLEMWRETGLRGAVILESARRLDETVDRLWNEVGMPVAIVDTTGPPSLPDPQAIVEASRQVAEATSYERDMPSAEFLGLAAPVRRLSLEELRGEAPDPEPDMSGELPDDLQKVNLEYGVGIPSSGPIRTRYFFAVRSVSEQGEEGPISDIVSLAPMPTPIPPGTPTAQVTEDGVELSWRPSGGDVWGRLLDAEEVGYNVYRRLSSDPRFDEEPLNDEPEREPELLDDDVTWGKSYVYEVRAVRVVPEDGDEEEGVEEEAGPTVSYAGRESAGVRSEEISVVDVFPPDPPRSPEALRTGTRITLRWTPPSDDDDVAGYRIYRHALPSPELPDELLREEDREEDEEAPADDEGPATGRQAGDVEEDADPTTTGADDAAEPEQQAPQAGEDEDQEAAVEDETEAVEEDGRRHPDRVRRRTLVRLGFELLTERVMEATRYIDTSTDPATGYVYLIETLDEAGNVSQLARVRVLGPEEDG